MRGDMDNGEAVIQALEKLGGRNTLGYSGDDPCGLYFFNSPSKAILHLDDTDYNALQILRERRQIYPNFQLCVYFKGDSNNSEKIIAELERLGGTNTFGIQANNRFRLYFIDRNNMILSIEQTSNLYRALVRYGVELTLPEVKTITIRNHTYEESAVLERISSLKPIK